MRIISLQQRDFARDMHMSDCVIIAFEAINLLDKKQYGGNITLKVDIRKAFNILDWNFFNSGASQFWFCDCIL